MDSSSLRGYLERGRSKEAIDCSGYHMWSWSWRRRCQDLGIMTVAPLFKDELRETYWILEE